MGSTGELLSHNVFAYCANNPVMRADPSGRAIGDTLEEQMILDEIVNGEDKEENEKKYIALLLDEWVQVVYPDSYLLGSIELIKGPTYHGGVSECIDYLMQGIESFVGTGVSPSIPGVPESVTFTVLGKFNGYNELVSVSLYQDGTFAAKLFSDMHSDYRTFNIYVWLHTVFLRG